MTRNRTIGSRAGPEPDFRRMLRLDLIVGSTVLLIVCAVVFVSTQIVRTHPAAKPVVASGSTDVSAQLSEWRVVLSRTTFRPGRYTFRIVNTGRAQHELIAFKTPVALSAIPLNAEGNVNEEASSLEKATDGDNLVAGKQQVRTIDLTSPGSYVFMCNLPGHYRLGMHTIVAVR